jgi:hypothetical protein
LAPKRRADSLCPSAVRCASHFSADSFCSFPHEHVYLWKPLRKGPLLDLRRRRKKKKKGDENHHMQHQLIQQIPSPAFASVIHTSFILLTRSFPHLGRIDKYFWILAEVCSNLPGLPFLLFFIPNHTLFLLLLNSFQISELFPASLWLFLGNLRI